MNWSYGLYKASSADWAVPLDMMTTADSRHAENQIRIKSVTRNP